MSAFFRCTYLNEYGKKQSRDFFSNTVPEIRQQIINSGGTVLSIKEKNHRWWEREYYSQNYKISFLKAMAMQIRAGSSPGRALSTVIQGESNSAKRIELNGALEMIERQGRDFSDAIERIDIFDKSILAILKAGERTGMKKAIDASIKYLTELKNGYKQFMTSMIWITIEFLMAASTPFSIQWYALPWIEKNSMNSKNPDDILKFKSDIELAYIINGIMMWGTVILVLGAIIGFLAYKTQPSVRNKIDNIIVKLPIVGKFIVDGSLSQSFSIASTMLSARVSFFEVVESLGRMASSSVVRSYWKRVNQRLASTGSPGEAMTQDLILNKDEAQLLRFHEDSNQLAESLELIAENRAESAKRNRVMMIAGGFTFMVVYIAISMGTALWIYGIYDSALTSNINNFDV